jgi:hypothetical protein
MRPDTGGNGGLAQRSAYLVETMAVAVHQTHLEQLAGPDSRNSLILLASVVCGAKM